ncbi:hypothetical protein [Microvirga tunisiensis]|uniref:Uncharacterized protein n=1 Tax=Microvirga tunisiensis TaxID=2108360 RepID=A0A5N7MSC2_9HYPH|nr:hypothetical protein [Microvirga tunisiensis]MPR11944.1 hypothetical protein [Microvirga tunisiensis]MPR29902.1 hypothetical protein [Microvirga tunisiensis]
MACLYCGSETDRCISADEATNCKAPGSGFTIHRNAGHPWDQRPGWDLMEVKAATESALTQFIARAAAKFWEVWIRDNTGQVKAVLYKPSQATGAWAGVPQMN